MALKLKNKNLKKANKKILKIIARGCGIPSPGTPDIFLPRGPRLIFYVIPYKFLIKIFRMEFVEYFLFEIKNNQEMDIRDFGDFSNNIYIFKK